MEQEVNCWRCGLLLRPKPAPPAPAGESQPPPPIQIEETFSSGGPPVESAAPAAAAEVRRTITRTTLTGEVVEVEEPAPPILSLERADGAPASAIDPVDIPSTPEEEVMVLTFCKGCGQQNEEGVRKCRKCGAMLEVVAVSALRDIAPLPRQWGFDVLGIAWIVLGFAAVYCGQFLVKADPEHPGITWADYFWTGIVVCAPGILIFLRHYFCKILFYVMTLGSLLVWAVIAFLWLYVGLTLSENAEMGLSWFALLSVLSAISYFTVRSNDAFDFGT